MLYVYNAPQRKVDSNSRNVAQAQTAGST